MVFSHLLILKSFNTAVQSNYAESTEELAHYFELITLLLHCILIYKCFGFPPTLKMFLFFFNKE